MGATQDTTMTVDRLLARLAWLEGERARLQREYERLGAELQARLRGADHVIADGYAQYPAPWAPPAEHGEELAGTFR
jgi:hypothetical protein